MKAIYALAAVVTVFAVIADLIILGAQKLQANAEARRNTWGN